jgi:hypothetical protein
VARGVDNHDEPFSDFDQHRAGIRNLGSFRNSDKIVHDPCVQFLNHVPPNSSSNPTASIGNPSFNDFALFRRSSMRPETTTRIPPAESQSPIIVTTKPIRRTALNTYSSAVTPRPLP